MATIEIRAVDATNMEIQLDGNALVRFPVERTGDDYRLSGVWFDSDSDWGEFGYGCENCLSNDVRFDEISDALDRLAIAHPNLSADITKIQDLIPS